MLLWHVESSLDGVSRGDSAAWWRETGNARTVKELWNRLHVKAEKYHLESRLRIREKETEEWRSVTKSPYFLFIINCFLCAFKVTQPSGSNGINLSVFVLRTCWFWLNPVGDCPLDQIRLHTLIHKCSHSCELPSLVTVGIIFSSQSGSGHFPVQRGESGKMTRCKTGLGVLIVKCLHDNFKTQIWSSLIWR